MPPFYNEQFNDPPMDGSNDAATYFVLFIFVLICIIFIIYFCVIIWAFACCVADPPVHNGRRSAVRYVVNCCPPPPPPPPPPPMHAGHSLPRRWCGSCPALLDSSILSHELQLVNYIYTLYFVSIHSLAGRPAKLMCPRPQ